MAAIDLYWIPLGAGGYFVRFNGRVYEAIVAARERRARRAIYHAALVVEVDGGPWAIELGPATGAPGAVLAGPVGSRLLGSMRLFRYELRCARGGTIPDLAEAADSPRRLSADAHAARRLLAAASRAPALVWGRDELGVGDMWNSNSVVAWLLAAAGTDPAAVVPPPGGRAPGWAAGVAAASGRYALADLVDRDLMPARGL